MRYTARYMSSAEKSGEKGEKKRERRSAGGCRRALSLAAAAVLVAVSLTGCGEQVQTEEFAPVIEITPETTQEVTAPQGELYTAMAADPKTLHPLALTTEEMVNLFGLIFEPGIRMKADGSLEGCICESWTVEENVFTFKIREGVRFHGDRGTVTAEDVKFTVELAKTLDSTNMYNINGSYITSCEIPEGEPMTLRITATEATNKILYFMTLPILSKSYYEDAALETDKLPVGTGPYMVDTYSDDGGMALTVNTSWWRVAPKIRTIYAKPYASVKERYDSFAVSVLDMISTSDITVENLTRSNAATSTNYTTLYYECLIPNFRRTAVSKKSVRQAISLSLDRKKLVSAGVLGQGIAAEIPIKPDSYLSVNSGEDLCQYSVPKAISLLNGAGYGEAAPLSLTLIASESDGVFYRETLANVIRSQLADIGIELKVEMLSRSDYEKRLKDGDFDLAMCQFNMRRDMDISFLLDNEINFGGFPTSILSGLAADAHSAVQGEELQSAYSALIAYLKEELPHIGLYYRSHAMVYDINVTGVRSLAYLDAFAGISDWSFDMG